MRLLADKVLCVVFALLFWIGSPPTEFPPPESMARRYILPAYCNILPPQIDGDLPMVALTFDDGPNYIYTPQVLEILEEYEVHATFFINGVNIAYNKSLIQQTVAGGHELANHTYHHRELIFLTDDQILYEVQQTQLDLQAVLPEYHLAYIRVPYGSFNSRVLDLLDQPMVLWDIDPRDWEAADADAIYNAVMPYVKDGDVVLFHDSNPRTVEAIRRIIPELLSQGYQLVTLSQLEQYREIAPLY